MKHITSLLILGSALAMAACQHETGGISGEDSVEVSITAGIPGAAATYAAVAQRSAGEAFSHQGGAMNVDQEEFDLRYIVEVWTTEETPRLAFRDVKTVDKDFMTTPVTFSMRLQAISYQFVFWADFVAQGSTEDLHYTTSQNLQNISYAADITEAGDLASDELDAYCAVETVDLLTEGMKKSVTLHRPFGKVRFIATDRIDSDDFIDIHPAVVTIDFKDAQLADTYNALTKKASVSGKRTAAGKYDFTALQEDALVSGTTYEGAYLLGFGYFFVADQIPSYSIDITVYGDNGKTQLLGTRSLSNIPVSENKLTTVINNFYSSEGTITIIADDNFDDPANLIDPEN